MDRGADPPLDGWPAGVGQVNPRGAAPWHSAAARTRGGARYQVASSENFINDRIMIIDLDHVDAAIRIFDPSYDVEGIRQKLPSAAHRALRGDLTRATLDTLRGTPGPMTTKELARHVMAERGLNTADSALLLRARHAVSSLMSSNFHSNSIPLNRK